jgi:hypothetical protein
LFTATHDCPVLHQINVIHTLLPYFLKIHFNIVLVSTTKSSQAGSSVFLFSPMHAMYHIHLTTFEFYKYWKICKNSTPSFCTVLLFVE